MEFQIGQVFIAVNMLTNMKGFTFRIIAPMGTHMMKIGATIENNQNQPLIASVEIYERGDKNAEESAIS